MDAIYLRKLFPLAMSDQSGGIMPRETTPMQNHLSKMKNDFSVIKILISLREGYLFLC